MKIDRRIYIGFNKYLSNYYGWWMLSFPKDVVCPSVRIDRYRVSVVHTTYDYDINLLNLNLRLTSSPIDLVDPSLKILLSNTPECNKASIASPVYSIIGKNKNNLPLDIFTQPLEKKSSLLLDFALRKLEKKVADRVANDIRIRDNYRTLIAINAKKA